MLQTIANPEAVVQSIPAEIAELTIWMTAVEQRAQLHHAARHTPENLAVYPRPDGPAYAAAIQDVQYALTAEGDPLELQTSLPLMADRARQHPYRPQFADQVKTHISTPIPFSGIESAALPLIQAVNKLLRAHGIQPYDNVAENAHDYRPSLLSRALARVVLGEARDMLFKTVLPRT